MTTAEVAEELGVSVSQVTRYVKRNGLKAQRVGLRVLLFSRTDVRTWKREIFPQIKTRGRPRRGAGPGLEDES